MFFTPTEHFNQNGAERFLAWHVCMQVSDTNRTYYIRALITAVLKNPKLALLHGVLIPDQEEVERCVIYGGSYSQKKIKKHTHLSRLTTPFVFTGPQVVNLEGLAGHPSRHLLSSDDICEFIHQADKHTIPARLSVPPTLRRGSTW